MKMEHKKVLSAVALMALSASSAAALEHKPVKGYKHSKKVEKAAEQTVAAAAEHADAAASLMKVTLGGKVDVQYASVRQSNKADLVDASHDSNHTHFKRFAKRGLSTDAKFRITAEGKSGGLTAGALIEVGPDADATKSKQAGLYLEHMYGRVEAGNLDSASETLKVSGTSVATGGASGGAWSDYVNEKIGNIANESGAVQATGGEFWLSGVLPADARPTYIKDGKVASLYNDKANKLTYYTPTWNGLTFGVTYVPDVSVRGSSGSLAASQTTVDSAVSTEMGHFAEGFKDVISAGAKYEYSYNGADVKVAFVSQTGAVKSHLHANHATNAPVARNKLRSWEASGSIGYMGFDIHGSFADLGKSGQKPVATYGNSKSTYWTAGAGYKFGPLAASVEYFNSKIGGPKAETNALGLLNKNRLKAWSVGVEYQLVQGVMPYAEYTNFKLDRKRLAADKQKANKGSVILVGTKLMF